LTLSPFYKINNSINYKLNVSYTLIRAGRDCMVVGFITTYMQSVPLTTKVQIPLGQGVLDTTLCDKVCQ